MSEPLHALLEIQRATGRPLVGQIVEQTRQLIADGRLPAGLVLPSSRSLADALKVSRNTVTFAIDQLASEGYVTLTRGKRPVVSADLGRHVGRVPSPTHNETRSSPELVNWVCLAGDVAWPASIDEPALPFRSGAADEREFPHDAWARCLRRAARVHRQDQSPNQAVLQQALSEHLAVQRGVVAEPDQIIILPTAQAGLALIAAITVAPGDRVWIESPGYAGAIAAFSAAGAQVVGIPLDEEGLTVSDNRPPPRLIFATPTHQFPTGRLMTVGRRLDLIAFAAKNNAWIIEDDYDGEFHYDERPVPALQGLDTTNRVFYIGTFSKTTFAALRTGYLVVPKHLVDACRIAQRHFGSFASVQVQHALADFISEGRLIAHVRRSRRMLRDRRDHLSMLLDQHANDHFKVEVPRGGMQLVAWCRDRSDDRKLAASLLKAGVVARPVSRMFTQGDTANGLLLGFGAWRESELEQGVRRLRRVLRSGAR